MSSSKQRLGSLEISVRNPSWVVSKQVPSQKLDRGNVPRTLIYPKSLKSVQRKPLTSQAHPRVSEMQRIGLKPEEEMANLMERLAVAEGERDRARDELEEMKKVAHEASLRLTDAEMSNGKVADVFSELNSVVEALSKSNQDLKIKEIAISSLKVELEKAKGLEKKLMERDASLVKLVEDLSNAKSSEAHALEELLASKKRIQEMEEEVEKRKESEMKMLDSFAQQTKQLEETKILLEDSKVEIAALREKVEKLEGSHGPKRDEDRSSKSELQWSPENFARVQKNGIDSELKAKNLLEEMELLKNELKLASEAEENSKKAMDDLALALKEVATQANQTKEKLILTQEELDHFKREAEASMEKLMIFQDKHKSLLDEARKEADQYRNTAERLRFEAEESLQAWNLKETEFVNCIKRTEEEKATALEENEKLLESLIESENKSKTAKQETQKLRDILKQALNEASVAKEAAEIARAENSQLKDMLTEKENALLFVTRQNESLRLNEAAALENINELKRLLSEASGKEVKGENGKDHEHTQGPPTPTDHRPPTPTEHREPKNLRKLSHTLSLNLKDLIVHNKHKHSSEDQKVVPDKPKGNDDDDEGQDSDNSDPLKGSIFDVANSPVAEAQLHKKSASAFVDFDGEAHMNPEEDERSAYDDGNHSDDLEHEIPTRKKRALLRRFGDIITRRSFHRRESSIGAEPRKETPRETPTVGE